MLIRKNKLTKLERLVKGASEIGKYIGFSAVLMSLSCDLPSMPKGFSVSENGRYVAVPFNKKLEIDFEESKRIVLYDALENKIIFSKEYEGEVFWINNSSTEVVFQISGPESNLVILSGDGQTAIPGGSFSDLSSDGRLLAYTKFIGGKEGSARALPKMELRVRDLKTKIEKIYDFEGITPNFSPDGKKIIFLEYHRVRDPDGTDYFSLSLLDLETNEKKIIDEIDKNEMILFSPPEWINNDCFVFSQKHRYFGEDPELMIGYVDGGLEQITLNTFAEIHAQGNSHGIFYNNLDNNFIYLVTGNEEGNALVSRKLKISTPLFRIAKDSIFYVEADKNSTRLFKTSLKYLPISKINDPNQAIDLTQKMRYLLIKEDLKKDPNNTDYLEYLKGMERRAIEN